MTDDHDPLFAATVHSSSPLRSLSSEAVAAAFGVSPASLRAWLRVGAGLGVRFELVSPLLALAYERLAEACASTRLLAFSRERLIVTEDGVVGIDIENADEHARIDRYLEAVALAALTQNDSALRRFAGMSVRGMPLVIDLDALTKWAQTVVSRGDAA